MPIHITSALLAGFGGLLPTVSQLAASFATQPSQPLPHPNIMLGIALFFIIGAVLGIAFNKECDFGKALVLGISAPGLITNILNGASVQPARAPQTPPPVVTTTSSTKVNWHRTPIFATSALAQEQRPSAKDSPQASKMPANSKSIVLTIQYQGPDTPEDNTVNVSVAKAGGSIEKIGVFRLGQAYVLPVPWDAQALMLQSGRSNITELQLWPNVAAPNSFAVNVRLSGETTGQGDFLWSLGARRKAVVTRLEAFTFPLLNSPLPMTCGDESRLSSLSGANAAEVSFSNKTDQIRKVFWINYQGQRVLYQILQPGQKYTQPTYITHPWVVTDEQDHCKDIMIPQSMRTDLIIDK